MTRKAGILIHSNELEERLGITMTGIEFPFDKWGRADNHLFLNSDSILAFEIEMSQRHPEMNVLKVWPYLKNNIDKKVLLVQYIIQETSVSPNRIRLCKWLKQEMELTLNGRFKYHLLINTIGDEEVRIIKEDINRFRET